MSNARENQKSILDVIFSNPIDTYEMNKSILSNAALTSYEKNKYQEDDEFFSDYVIVQVPSQGAFCCDKDDYIKNYLSVGRAWEPHFTELIHTYVKKDSIAIDIGAHIGTHTITMSSCVGKNGVVLAFEPQKKIHKELLTNCQLNHCANVLSFQCALGDHQGRAYLGKEQQFNEGARYISSKHPVESIAMLTLDSLSLEHVSFIKIDVESYEKEVLMGAKQTILRNKPIILIEIGGGLAKEREENTNPQMHLQSVIDILTREFDYKMIPILVSEDLSAGEYLAIP